MVQQCDLVVIRTGYWTTQVGKDFSTFSYGCDAFMSNLKSGQAQDACCWGFLGFRAITSPALGHIIGLIMSVEVL